MIFALVKVGDEKVEDGGILLWQVKNLCPCLHEVAAQGPLKVFGLDENIFVYLFEVLGRSASRRAKTDLHRMSPCVARRQHATG